MARRMHTMAAWTPYRSALPDDWEERAGALGDEEVLEGLDHEARTDIESIRAAI